MWIIGKVVNVKDGSVGIWGDTHSADRTTLFLKAADDIVDVICDRAHVPDDILDQYVRIDVRLRQIRIPSPPFKRWEVLYEAENCAEAIELLGRTAVRLLKLIDRSG